MEVLNRLFRRRGKEEEVSSRENTSAQLTELEEICSDSPEIFEALKNTMFLDPRKIDVSFDEAVSKAKEMEKAKDKLRAAIWYRIAAGLAIYEGNVSKVKECLGKYARLTGVNLKILENPEKTIEKAREYYEKYLEGKRTS